MKENNLESIIKVYADALFGHAKKENLLSDILNDIELINGDIVKINNFTTFMRHIKIDDQAKHNLVTKAFGQSVSTAMNNFLHLLISKKRFSLLGGILKKVKEIADKEKGFLSGTVVSSINLDEPQKNSLKIALENVCKNKLNITYKVDPQIIGGIIFNCDGKIIDYSIKGRLEKMKAQMLN